MNIFVHHTCVLGDVKQQLLKIVSRHEAEAEGKALVYMGGGCAVSLIADAATGGNWLLTPRNV